MASLHSLPPELVDEIVNHLDEDEHLALRLTCKDLNFKTHEAHLESKYRMRRVFFVPAGLDNILKISRHPSGVNKRVKHIIFSGTSPYYQAHVTHMRHSPLPTIATESTDSVLSKLELVAHSDLLELQEINRPESGEDTSTLTLAFMNLPGLQSITFQTQLEKPHLSRSEINLFYPSLGLKPGTLIPRDLANIVNNKFERHWGLKNCWHKVMSAAVTAGVNSITSIQNTQVWDESGRDIPLNYFLPAQPRRLTRLRALFTNLRVLDLGLGSYGSSNTTSLKRVTPWLEAVGTRLEVLKLRLVKISQGIATARAINILTLPMLSFLKTIVLKNFSFEVENFKAAIYKCQDTLIDLKISNCDFRDNKDDWFAIFHVLRDRVKGLRSFTLEGWTGSWDVGDEDAPDYVLPDYLSIEGLWALESTECMVRLDFVDASSIIVSRRINQELHAHGGADGFWDSITDGLWKAEARVAATRRRV
ncbi:hypothetical protein TWF506_003182 [Arthrobotrys conoides]|uniref:F-box domain-containing protein n=1 Tax=Arthrobotrys conoides TaxID=74498 RepID=A0AAN8RRF4_9PEZI